MITYEELLESAVLNSLKNSSGARKSYYTICQELRDLCPETSKVIKNIIDFRRSGLIEEKNFGDDIYLALTDKGIDRNNKISRDFSSQISLMKKYYTDTEDLHNEVISTDKLKSNNVEVTEYASFGENIKEVKVDDNAEFKETSDKWEVKDEK